MAALLSGCTDMEYREITEEDFENIVGVEEEVYVDELESNYEEVEEIRDEVEDIEIGNLIEEDVKTSKTIFLSENDYHNLSLGERGIFIKVGEIGEQKALISVNGDESGVDLYQGQYLGDVYLYVNDIVYSGRDSVKSYVELIVSLKEVKGEFSCDDTGRTVIGYLTSSSDKEVSSKTDLCEGDNLRIDYYCGDNDVIQKNEVKCEYGCDDGKCNVCTISYEEKLSNVRSLSEGEVQVIETELGSYKIEVLSVSNSKVLMSINGETKSYDTCEKIEFDGITLQIDDLISSSRDEVKGYTDISYDLKKEMTEEVIEEEVKEEYSKVAIALGDNEATKIELGSRVLAIEIDTINKNSAYISINGEKWMIDIYETVLMADAYVHLNDLVYSSRESVKSYVELIITNEKVQYTHEDLQPIDTTPVVESCYVEDKDRLENQLSLGENQEIFLTINSKPHSFKIESVADTKILMTIDGETESYNNCEKIEFEDFTLQIDEIMSSAREGVSGYAELSYTAKETLLLSSNMDFWEDQSSNLYEVSGSTFEGAYRCSGTQVVNSVTNPDASNVDKTLRIGSCAQGDGQVTLNMGVYEGTDTIELELQEATGGSVVDVYLDGVFFGNHKLGNPCARNIITLKGVQNLTQDGVVKIKLVDGVPNSCEGDPQMTYLKVYS